MFDVSRLVTHRRGFLGRIAAGAAALTVGGAGVKPREALAELPLRSPADPQFSAWLAKMNGKHKMVFDVPAPNGGFAFAWARVFLNTANDQYGTTDADNTAVVVLRHSGIPLGMQSPMWAKYKWGEFLKVNDGDTPATRNLWVDAKPGELPLPGMAVNELLAKGVLIGICNVALTVYSGIVAKKMGLQADAVKQDWVANLVPGIQVVPSGVIAVSGAQEKGCGYCFGG
ncbi:MAG TPA: twin-arginine translocation signal domain-containing protein [Gemmatimonadales bacterium]|nr:twin-arginine translocation signal domain-containing protein [Gemmatimonadales bacterium]